MGSEEKNDEFENDVVRAYIGQVEEMREKFEKVTSVDLEVSSATPEEGENIFFTCNVDSSEETKEYSWFHENDILKSGDSPTFKLENGSNDDSGDYYCRVTFKSNRKMYAKVSVAYRYLDTPTVEVSTTTPREGDDVTLTCKVNSSDEITSFTWFHNDGLIPSATENVYTISNGSSDDSGDYSCKVTTAHQRRFAENVSVTIPWVGLPEGRHFTGKSIGLIINNDFKDDADLELRGGKADEQKIIDTFGNLNVQFDVKNNLEGDRTIKEIFKWLNLTDFEDADCSMCFILSHGDQDGVVYGADMQAVKLEEIKELFVECEKLKGKPKLFFIQACRGRYDSDYDVVDGGDAVDGAIRTAGRSVMKVRDADVFQFFPTVSGKKANLLDTEEGSLFIKILCNVVNAYGSKHSLQDIVTKVNQMMSREIMLVTQKNNFGEIACQASETTHSLTYDLYFHDKRD